jgi:uncharacterized sporulation protein YeaH/YhbH (DUF444 family)
MPYFIDRRSNPKDKSLGNRQRFMRRARARIKEVVDKSVNDRNISDVANGETISIPTKGIDEPRFRNAGRGGRRARVFTGNREFVVGDTIDRPPSGGGEGGKRGSEDGGGEDEFRFTLSRDEFLDLFFEDLELPDLVKTDLREVYAYTTRRAGHTVTGTPTNLNVLRTIRNSYGRRLALKRPRQDEVDETERRIFELEEKSDPSGEELRLLSKLQERLEEIMRKRRFVPFIDPIDIRYNNFEPKPEPNTKAVMFCLMDVSGSMGQREKDLAKRFFVLLHLFLSRRYERTDIVFIRHTHLAQEVDEETFFYSQETGGTVVSTALEEMRRIIGERYPSGAWNIYAAQASDGENLSSDSENCIALLNDELMPLVQYYAYVEILDEREIDIFGHAFTGIGLWSAYNTVSARWSNFEMKRIARPGDIYPVFRELFDKQRDDA